MPWYYRNREQQILGPIDLQTLHQLARDGQVTAETQVSFVDQGQTPRAWQAAWLVQSLDLPRMSSAGSAAPQPPPRVVPPNSPLESRRRSKRKRPRMGCLAMLLILLGCSAMCFAALFKVLIFAKASDPFGDYYGRRGVQQELVYLISDWLGSWGVAFLIVALLIEILRAQRGTQRGTMELHDLITDFTAPRETLEPPRKHVLD